MPRKGWMQVEVPSGWTQLIRGPRPKSVQWPKAVRMSSAVPAGAPQVQRVPRGRWRQQEDFARKNPETSLEASRKRVRAPRSSTRRLDGEWGTRFARDQDVAKFVGCGKACSSGAPRRSAVGPVRTIHGKGKETVDPTRRATCRVGQGVGQRRGTHGTTPCPSVESPSSSNGDFRRGRDRQIEGDGRHHGRGVRRSSPVGQCEEASHNTDQWCCSGREDFVPQCDEEMEEWMAGCHADLHTAMVAGQLPEVARISQLVTHAAQEWHQLIQGPRSCPSVVANTVR